MNGPVILAFASPQDHVTLGFACLHNSVISPPMLSSSKWKLINTRRGIETPLVHASAFVRWEIKRALARWGKFKEMRS